MGRGVEIKHMHLKQLNPMMACARISGHHYFAKKKKKNISQVTLSIGQNFQTMKEAHSKTENIYILNSLVSHHC